MEMEKTVGGLAFGPHLTASWLGGLLSVAGCIGHRMAVRPTLPAQSVWLAVPMAHVMCSGHDHHSHDRSGGAGGKGSPVAYMR
jgi:hypothetical protein